MATQEVDHDEIAGALRRVRASVYRLTQDAGGTSIALVLDVSASGRRNAAARIVDELAAHGLRLEADDPVDALTASTDPLTVRRAD